MTEFFVKALDVAMNIDVHLSEIVSAYQYITYIILFAIIFCETGLVIMPFLPGDTLLFAVGAISALDSSPLNLFTVIVVLLVAAFVGDNTNFFIGRSIGHKLYKGNNRIIKRKYLDKTHEFYEKYGGITLVFARFTPVVRTFAPFVAGVGEMDYHRFLFYCITGNIAWVLSFTTLGYFFGNLPFVKDNFLLVIGFITLLSVMPAVIALIRKTKKVDTV